MIVEIKFPENFVFMLHSIIFCVKICFTDFWLKIYPTENITECEFPLTTFSFHN